MDSIGGGYFLPLFLLPLSGSADTRAQEMSRQGAQILLKLIQEEKIKELKVILEPRLVIKS